jgi:beta-mannosidase
MNRLDLSGKWTLTRIADGSRRPAIMPGDILSALIASGEAPDPYYDRNELGLQWIGREEWLLERDIELDSSFVSAPSVVLSFEMLDTIAEVSLNGIPVGSGANMFRLFRADVTHAAKPGANHISVLIRSPEKAAIEAAARLPYPIPCSSYPVESPHRNLIRKAPFMAGWDWGPCLMTGGIYDGLCLESLAGPRIEYAVTAIERHGEAWAVDVEVELESRTACRAELTASLAGSTAKTAVEVPAGRSIARIELLVRDVERWWPAGYGVQALYELVLRCPQSGQELRKRIGFRELEVVAEPDAIGRSLLFRVNGRDIFCKGANWAPADALPSRWSRGRHEDLLESAVQANMNCLRVNGVGRYESDDFYELCDQKGILVWQDFMFSCGLYPSDPAFLAEVEAEVRHQVKRLKDHPSIALWCGNNENLGALSWYPDVKKNPMRYIIDYDRLYEGTVGRVVKELDPSRTWWPTSPCGGPSDFSDTWHGDGRGDMHYWSVWHEGKSFSEYLTVRPRFCSEFGFQSFPNHATVLSYAPEGERNVMSPTMEHHQRHIRGNALIIETMSRYFRMPTGLRETLYLSQVQQAMAIRTAVDYWRSLRPTCMGTLFWQLNDVWPVSSWSSLDYDGSWKLLHFEARRFYESLRLAIIIKEGRAAVVLLNDGAEAWAGELAIDLRLLDGSSAAAWKLSATAGPESATELWSAFIRELPKGPGKAFLDARLETRPAGEAETVGGRGVSRRAIDFLVEPKRYSLPDPCLHAKVVEGSAGPELLLVADKPAFYVAPDAGALGGRFEDSGFHLMPGAEKRLAYLPAKGKAAPTPRALEAALTVMHLRASYE